MSSVVRCFRVKIMLRKQDLVEKVKEQYREERYRTWLVDSSLKHNSITDEGYIKAVGT